MHLPLGLHATKAGLKLTFTDPLDPGSVNLDHWSDRRNLEVSVSVLDRGAASALDEQFQRDLEGAEEVRLETWERRGWPIRLLAWLAYQLLRI